MQTIHYGRLVDSEVPITGVISNNSVPNIWDDFYSGINLRWEEFMDGNPTEEEQEAWENDASDTILIGDWLKDEDGKYYPDENGDYSAIVREFVTQVVFSKNTKRCALCSPCYPAQGDLDGDGEFLAYDLPEELYNWE